MLAVGNVEKKMDLYFVSKANALKKKPNQRKQDLEKTGRNNTLIARKTKKDKKMQITTFTTICMF